MGINDVENNGVEDSNWKVSKTEKKIGIRQQKNWALHSPFDAMARRDYDPWRD